MLKTLRTKAEGLLGAPSVAPTAQPDEVMLHELLVHKIELEMQNEELRRAYAELEEARDRYVDLYDFSPIGYLTLNREGMVSEINLTACTLLGEERAKLLNHRFAKFIAPLDQDHWHCLFMRMMKSFAEKQALDLSMLRLDGTLFRAHLDCLRYDLEDTPSVLRIALADIGRHEHSETQ